MSFWTLDEDGLPYREQGFDDDPTFATIGSSDCAPILGVSPWRTAWDVWPGLVGLAPRYGQSDNPAQARGRRIERFVLDWYAQDHDAHIEPGPGLFDRVAPPVKDGWAHDRYDALQVDRSDRFRGQIAIAAIEVKSLRWFDAQWGAPGTDCVPLGYLTQCVHHHFVTGLPVVLVAFATGPDELRTYRIEPDSRLVDRQVELLQAWHKAHVVEGTLPPLDETRGCAKGLGKLYEYGLRRGKDVREATAHEVELAHELADLNSQIAQLDVQASTVKNALRSSIGKHYGIKAPGGRKSIALWYPQRSLNDDLLAERSGDLDLAPYRKPGTVDKAKLRKTHPQLVDRCTVETGRTFRLYPDNLPPKGQS